MIRVRKNIARLLLLAFLLALLALSAFQTSQRTIIFADGPTPTSPAAGCGGSQCGNGGG